MATTKKMKKQASVRATEHKKSPAKPISLYPMSEEEALKRLLRVPPPEKAGKSGHGD